MNPARDPDASGSQAVSYFSPQHEAGRAGPACHGQIVVLQDLLGLTSWQPSFAPPVANLGEHLIAAAHTWIEKVRTSAHGGLGEHPYTMSEDEKLRFGR